MATTNKFFKVKNGLDVNSNATVDASGNANIAGNLTANAGFISADTFRFDTTYATGPSQVGEITWDPNNETAQLQLDAHTIVQIGQEQVIRVKNSDVANAIPIRTAVMFAGAAGDTVTVAPANSANIAVTPSDYLVGITAEEIPADGFGFVTEFGVLPNVNTAAFTLGNLLYVDPANPGQFVTTRPSAPAWQTAIAAVTKVASGSGGRILVRAVSGTPINRVEGVEITSATANDVLRVNANGIVVNSNLATAGIANLSGATFTGNVAGTNIDVSGNVNAITFNGNLVASIATVSGNNVLTTASSIDALSDVTISSPTSGQVLKWNGSAWINDTDATSAGGGGNTFETISANGTSVVADSSTDTLTLTPGNGLSIVGNATSDTITFTPNVAGASANGIVTTGTQTLAGNKTFSNTVAINGNTHLGLAETQVPTDYSNNYTLATNNHFINLAAGNYFTNINTQRKFATGWTEVGTGVTLTTAASPATFSLSALGAQEEDIVVVFASTEAAAHPTTTSTGWSTQNSGNTTYAGALFWKQMGPTPDANIVLTSYGTSVTSFVAKAFRPNTLTSTIGGTTVVDVVTVQTTAWAVGTSTTPDAAAVTSGPYANALAITVFSNENVNVTAVTPPTGYVNASFATNYTSTTNGSVSAMAYKSSLISTELTAENAGTWSYTHNGAGTPAWAATTLFLQAYLDPTIDVFNPYDAPYSASTYVLHINNTSNIPITWGTTYITGYSWQGGTAPTLSSVAPNNIVILETIDGSTFRGAALTSYA